MSTRDGIPHSRRRPLAADDWPDDEPEDVENDVRLAEAMYNAWFDSYKADDADLRELDDARDHGFRSVAEQRQAEREDEEAREAEG